MIENKNLQINQTLLTTIGNEDEPQLPELFEGFFEKEGV